METGPVYCFLNHPRAPLPLSRPIHTREVLKRFITSSGSKPQPSHKHSKRWNTAEKKKTNRLAARDFAKNPGCCSSEVTNNSAELRWTRTLTFLFCTGLYLHSSGALLDAMDDSNACLGNISTCSTDYYGNWQPQLNSDLEYNAIVIKTFVP